MTRAGRWSAVAGLVAVLLLVAASRAPAQDLDSLERAARHDSLDGTAQIELAFGYWDAKRFDAADSALHRALLIDPHDAEAHIALGFLPYWRYRKLAEQDEKGKVPDSLTATVRDANAHLRQAFLLDPFVTWARQDYVFLPAFAMREYSDQEKARLPDWFFWWRGMALARGQEYDRALGDLHDLLSRFDSARAQVPQNAWLPLAANDIRYVMAAVEAKAGRRTEARQHFEQVLTQDLGMYMAHVQLAALLERTGAFNAAVRERQRALDAAPDDPALVYDLGLTMARAQMLPQADSVIARAITLNPHNPAYVFNLARVRQVRADTTGAVDAYRRFLAIAPSTLAPDIARAQHELDALGRTTGQ